MEGERRKIYNARRRGKYRKSGKRKRYVFTATISNDSSEIKKKGIEKKNATEKNEK